MNEILELTAVSDEVAVLPVGDWLEILEEIVDLIRLIASWLLDIRENVETTESDVLSLSVLWFAVDG